MYEKHEYNSFVNSALYNVGNYNNNSFKRVIKVYFIIKNKIKSYNIHI